MLGGVAPLIGEDGISSGLMELAKIVRAYVAEQCEFDHSPLDEAAREEVVAEILLAMRR